MRAGFSRGADVFILDEPTQGIDVGVKVEVYNLIKRLTCEGKGVILISSDLEELLAISDTILIVRDGRIVETGSAEKTDRSAWRRRYSWARPCDGLLQGEGRSWHAE